MSAAVELPEDGGLVLTGRLSLAAHPWLADHVLAGCAVLPGAALAELAVAAADQAGCAILAGNYGEAGAIDHFGPALGLPAAISGHNSYYFWGPRAYTGSCVILFGERADELKELFEDVRFAGTITDPHAAVAERNVHVYICRKPRAPLAELWPHFKLII